MSSLPSPSAFPQPGAWSTVHSSSPPADIGGLAVLSPLGVFLVVLLPNSKAIRPSQDLDPAKSLASVIPYGLHSAPTFVSVLSWPLVTSCCCLGSIGCALSRSVWEDLRSTGDLFCFTSLQCFICKFRVLYRVHVVTGAHFLTSIPKLKKKKAESGDKARMYPEQVSAKGDYISSST